MDGDGEARSTPGRRATARRRTEAVRGWPRRRDDGRRRRVDAARGRERRGERPRPDERDGHEKDGPAHGRSVRRRTGYASRDAATARPRAAELLQSVGLRPDGPVLWGRPVPARRARRLRHRAARAARHRADRADPGRQVDRARPELRLDGERPTSRALAARLPSFWLPARRSSTSAPPRDVGGRGGGRCADAARRPAAVCRRSLAQDAALTRRARVWWAPTDATEEYEDALLRAFADGRPARWPRRRPSRTSCCRGPSFGGRPASAGRTASPAPLLAEVVAAPPPGTTCRRLPAGDAEGAAPMPPHRRPRQLGGPPARRGARRRRQATAAPASAACVGRREGDAGRGGAGQAPTEVHLSPEGHARLEAELDELRPGPPPGGHPARRHGPGARRPQGERRVPRGARGASLPRGPDPGDRGPAPLVVIVEAPAARPP